MSEAADFFEAVAAGDLTKVRELLGRTPSLVSIRDSGGATPVHIAAFSGRRDVVRYLTAQGADVNARDRRSGATPAGWAIEYLRELGGFLAIEIEDMIAAIRQREVGWVRRFITRLPRLAACRDRDGKPLLQHAEESGDPEITRLFRETIERVREAEKVEKE